MNIEDVRLKPGKYVVAVSGGVDSVVLLDVLSKQADVELIVAHFDHGIRPESAADADFVEALARRYGLPFETDSNKLGPRASEAAARTVRYEFLRNVLHAQEAVAIVTAHHQDDVLETAIINLLRGTGRKGLTALKDRHDIRRPFLQIPKQALIDYAQSQHLQWHEDSTNADDTYLRNYVRHKLLSKFTQQDRAALLLSLEKQRVIDTELDALLVSQLIEHCRLGAIDRQWFAALPHEVAREVLTDWLRAHDVRNFDQKTIERLVVGAKTGRAGSRHDVLAGVQLKVSRDSLALSQSER